MSAGLQDKFIGISVYRKLSKKRKCYEKLQFVNIEGKKITIKKIMSAESVWDILNNNNI